MALRSSSPMPPSLLDLRAISYEDTVAGKPPTPIAANEKRIPSPNAHKTAGGRFRQSLSPQSHQRTPIMSRSKFQDDVRRDSGLATSSSTARDSRTTLGTEVDSIRAPSIRLSPSLPNIVKQESGATSAPITTPKPKSSAGTRSDHPTTPVNDSTVPKQHFLGMLPEIPTGSFEDLTLPGKVEFSKRGSMLIAGRKAHDGSNPSSPNGRTIGSRRRSAKRDSYLKPAPAVPTRVLSADDEALSQRVRSMYQDGGVEGKRAAAVPSVTVGGIGQDENIESADAAEKALLLNGEVHPAVRDTPDSPLLQPRTESTETKINNLLRGPNELAGGIEDWEDLNGDVDRYGFIVPRKLSSQASSLSSARGTPDPPRIQRVSTLLQLTSESPRQSRSRLGIVSFAQSSSRSVDGASARRPESTLNRPTSSQGSHRTVSSQSRLRNVTNHFPYNKDRRCVDEAGDMLTLPPGLADIAEDQESGQIANNLKRREWEREEKWRKMAKNIKRDKHGGGMAFEFDTNSPKLIERTWKGIPDRWRATAWHSFLTTSAKKRSKTMTNDEELIAIFRTLLNEGSPDDVQIDIDVPRTISSHIMFRRRYRGGQRLLFRVLHCVSIYFPDTGYVQGMAALAATLLCYYDEEMTFVMMVRLWQLRGLDRLYKAGFEGLMQALEEFEAQWLGKGEVAAKLVCLSYLPYLPSFPQLASIRANCTFFLSRPISTSPQPPTAPAGTSPSSTTPSPSPPSSASGTSSCCSATPTPPRPAPSLPPHPRPCQQQPPRLPPTTPSTHPKPLSTVG